LQDLEKNFHTWVAALELVYGKCTIGTKRPHNQWIVKKTLTAMLSYVHHGIKPVKDLCHAWRTQALTGEHGKEPVPQYTTPKRLFVASTLSRAIGDPTTVRPLVPEMNDAIESTLQTWHTPAKPIPIIVLDSIYMHARYTMERTNHGVATDPSLRILPLASRKACAERPSREGGVTRELTEQIEKERQAEYRRQLFPGHNHLFWFTPAERRWEHHPSGLQAHYGARTKEEGGGIPFTLSPVDHDLLRKGATEMEIYQHALRRTLDDEHPLLAEPVTVPEWGCKLRIASQPRHTRCT